MCIEKRLVLSSWRPHQCRELLLDQITRKCVVVVQVQRKSASSLWAHLHSGLLTVHRSTDHGTAMCTPSKQRRRQQMCSPPCFFSCLADQLRRHHCIQGHSFEEPVARSLPSVEDSYTLAILLLFDQCTPAVAHTRRLLLGQGHQRGNLQPCCLSCASSS